MNTQVYFIRHSKSDFSIKDDRTRPLTMEGIEHSIELAKIFEDIKIDYIYSSPYKRVIQTIEPIVKYKNMEIITINNFRERKIGEKWIDNFLEFSKEQWKDFSYKLSDGESLIEVQERNIKELEKILLKNNGKSIIIGTHGTALSTIINYYDKSFNFENFLEIVDIMPYIIKFEFSNKRYIGREEIKIK